MNRQADSPLPREMKIPLSEVDYNSDLGKLSFRVVPFEHSMY